MNKPMLFIPTCIYNETSRLNKTLLSLLNQTETNFIHYIYEDGSTILSDKVVGEYIEQVNKLNKPYKVIYEIGSNNLGVDKAHEYVFKKMVSFNCDYFLPCFDAGDFFEKNLISYINHFIKKQKDIDYFIINRKKTNDMGDIEDLSEYQRFSLFGKILSKNKDGLPSYAKWQGFHFGLFVIKISSFLSINPDFRLFDGFALGGNNYYYDHQLIDLLCLFKQKRGYIKKCLGYHEYNNHSASKVGPRFSLKAFNESRYTYLSSFNIDKHNIKTFIAYLFIANRVLNRDSYFYKKHLDDFAYDYYLQKRFMKENKLPDIYRIKVFRNALLRCYYSFIHPILTKRLFAVYRRKHLLYIDNIVILS